MSASDQLGGVPNQEYGQTGVHLQKQQEVLPLFEFLRANSQSWAWDKVNVAVSFAVSHATAIGTLWAGGKQTAGLGRVGENFFNRCFRRAADNILQT
jgi:GMP synthase-like glutamine amidotransferase